MLSKTQKFSKKKRVGELFDCIRQGSPAPTKGRNSIETITEKLRHPLGIIVIMFSDTFTAMFMNPKTILPSPTPL